jgi:hypothetical protein
MYKRTRLNFYQRSHEPAAMTKTLEKLYYQQETCPLHTTKRIITQPHFIGMHFQHQIWDTFESNIIEDNRNTVEILTVAEPFPKPIEDLIKEDERLFKIWLTEYAASAIRGWHEGYRQIPISFFEEIAEELIENQKFIDSKSL